MCTKSELQDILTVTENYLKSVLGVSLKNVLLYGSYARGDYTAESDIDIMAIVDLPKEELHKYRRAVNDFSSGIDLEYGVLLSIKLQDAQTFNNYCSALPYYANVIKEGVSVV